MKNVIPFPASGRARESEGRQAHPTLITTHDELSPYGVTLQENLLKVRELKRELLDLVDERTLSESFTYRVSCPDVATDRAERESAAIDELEELVVFSPEIQHEIFGRPGGRDAAPVLWGDVFLKLGDAYPFVFTVYTEEYAREQARVYGERIEPSATDVLLRRRHLLPADVIRAVIKWVNRHRPLLRGRPISLEGSSVLKTLVCDPGVELTCQDPD